MELLALPLLSPCWGWSPGHSHTCSHSRTRLSGCGQKTCRVHNQPQLPRTGPAETPAPVSRAAPGSGLRDRHRWHRPTAPASTASWLPAPTCSFSARPAGLRGAADSRNTRPDLTNQRELPKPQPRPAESGRKETVTAPPGRAGPHFQNRLSCRAWRPELASRPPCRGLEQATSHQTAENQGKVPKAAAEFNPWPVVAKGQATPDPRARTERRGAFQVVKGPTSPESHTLKNHPSK